MTNRRKAPDSASTTGVEHNDSNNTPAQRSTGSTSTPSQSVMNDAVIRRFENQFSSIERSLASLEATVKSLESIIRSNAGQLRTGSQSGHDPELQHAGHEPAKQRRSLPIPRQRSENGTPASRDQTFLDVHATSRHLREADGDNDGLALHGLSVLWESFWQDPEFVKLAQPRNKSELAYFAFPDDTQLADSKQASYAKTFTS